MVTTRVAFRKRHLLTLCSQKGTATPAFQDVGSAVQAEFAKLQEVCLVRLSPLMFINSSALYSMSLFQGFS